MRRHTIFLMKQKLVDDNAHATILGDVNKRVWPVAVHIAVFCVCLDEVREDYRPDVRQTAKSQQFTYIDGRQAPVAFRRTDRYASKAPSVDINSSTRVNFAWSAAGKPVIQRRDVTREEI